MNLNLLCM